MFKERCQVKLSYSVDFHVEGILWGDGVFSVGVCDWLWGYHVCLSVLKNKLFLRLCYLYWILVTRTAFNLGCNLSLSWNYLIKLLEYSRTTLEPLRSLRWPKKQKTKTQTQRVWRTQIRGDLHSWLLHPDQRESWVLPKGHWVLRRSLRIPGHVVRMVELVSTSPKTGQALPAWTLREEAAADGEIRTSRHRSHIAMRRPVTSHPLTFWR